MAIATFDNSLETERNPWLHLIFLETHELNSISTIITYLRSDNRRVTREYAQIIELLYLNVCQ